MEKETTTLQSIACGGTGGDLTAVDAKDGKIVRIRPINYLDTYTKEELRALPVEDPGRRRGVHARLQVGSELLRAGLQEPRVLQEPRPASAEARRLGAGR